MFLRQTALRTGGKKTVKYQRNLAVPGSEMYIVLMWLALRLAFLILSILKLDIEKKKVHLSKRSKI